MILLAFDVDGTLDSSAGPVKWDKVRALALANPVTFHTVSGSYGGIMLGIVSPSANRPKDDTPAYLAGSGIRADNLRLFAGACPGATMRLYVSDNNDPEAAAAAGFTFITHTEFARGLT